MGKGWRRIRGTPSSLRNRTLRERWRAEGTANVLLQGLVVGQRATEDEAPGGGRWAAPGRRGRHRVSRQATGGGVEQLKIRATRMAAWLGLGNLEWALF